MLTYFFNFNHARSKAGVLGVLRVVRCEHRFCKGSNSTCDMSENAMVRISDNGHNWESGINTFCWSTFPHK